MAQRSPTHAALGIAVRHLRIRRAVSQETLAAESGMHRTYLGGIERGERNPSYTNLTRLARALDVRASDLVAQAERIEADGRRAVERADDPGEVEDEADQAVGAGA